MKTMRNPGAIHAATLPNRTSPWRTEAEEQAARQDGAEAQLQVLRALLPGIFTRFAKIEDPRRPGSVKHKATVVLTFALLMAIYQIGSRRQANRELSAPTFWENLRSVFPDLDTVPHADTVARYLEEIPADELIDVLLATIRHLMRGKKLTSWLAREGYVVAIDGTQKWASFTPFAPEALHRKRGAYDIKYQVYVLEAVLVGPHGVSLPLFFEFCENDPQAGPETKQDSEQKAFKRLTGRLKRAFPRVRFVLVMDGLYPNGPVMALCRTNHWDFMIVLPDACLPSVWEEVHGLHTLNAKDQRRHRWGNHEQLFWWVNHIVYTWKDTENRFHHMRLHVVVCEETWRENGQPMHSRWAWVSSVPLTAGNVVRRCNEMARRRWDIEEGLLVEKHFGYHYEHLYSRDWNAMRGWHALFALGQLINTLSLHVEQIWPIYQQFGLRGTIRFLRTTMMGLWLDRARLRALCHRPPQLRLIL